MVRPGTFEAFVGFSKEHLLSGDFDPNYFVLRSVFDKRGYDEARRLDFIFCYLGCYDLGTAELLANDLFRYGRLPATADLAKGKQRRGFRGNENFLDYFAESRSLSIDDVRTIVSERSPTDAWTELRRRLEEIKHVGSYTSYKFCDLISYTMDFRITAPDIGTGGNGALAGPIPGLVRLSGETWDDCATKFEIQERFFKASLDAGVPFRGYEEFETCLCDFNKWCNGTYYVGHDIDEQMEIFKPMSPVYWEARKARFPEKYLGEFGGWFGVQKQKLGRRK